MSNKTDEKIRPVEWMGVSATAMVIIGIGMNIFVTQTLGSFSAASVLLALYLAFWAYVLGNIVLIVLAIWLFVTRRSSVPEGTIVKRESEDHERVARAFMTPRKVA